MRDYRVPLIAFMSFLYLCWGMFGARASAILESSVTSAHLLSVSPDKFVIEVGPVHSRQKTEQYFSAVYAPFFFQAIPINSADKEMLMTVKGIGPALADSIVAYRQKAGPFKTEEDLTRMPGVGIKKAASLASSLLFDEVP